MKFRLNTVNILMATVILKHPLANSAILQFKVGLTYLFCKNLLLPYDSLVRRKNIINVSSFKNSENTERKRVGQTDLFRINKFSSVTLNELPMKTRE